MEHIPNIDGLLAPFNDFVGYLMEQPLDPFGSVVMLGVFPDHPDSVEQTGQQVGNFPGRGTFELFARLIQAFKVIEVVLRLH